MFYFYTKWKVLPGFLVEIQAKERCFRFSLRLAMLDMNAFLWAAMNFFLIIFSWSSTAFSIQTFVSIFLKYDIFGRRAAFSGVEMGGGILITSKSLTPFACFVAFIVYDSFPKFTVFFILLGCGVANTVSVWQFVFRAASATSPTLFSKLLLYCGQ